MPSVWTFLPKTEPVEPGVLSNFGNIRRDGSREPLTGILGNGIQTTDATGTPVTSPVSATIGTVITLNIPASASSITITPKTNAVQVSEIPGTSSLSSYYECPAGTPQTFDVANQSTIYLLGVTGTSVVSFVFQIV